MKNTNMLKAVAAGAALLLTSCTLDGSKAENSELLPASSPGASARHAKSLINLNDAAQVRERRPLLIAHRGGVITEKSPECSLAAIELAANSATPWWNSMSSAVATACQ